MVLFIFDVESYKGMFYSVHDFCGPKTNSIIAEQSQKQWMRANEGVLAAQNMEEQKCLAKMRERGVEPEATLKLKEIKNTAFTRTHGHNRLYKDLLPLEDKNIACSKRLGEMNSDSMSFKSIAPGSYKYWRLHYEP